MSTSAVSKSLMVPARAVEAVMREAEALGVDDARMDGKALATALLEAAAEELLRATRFADRVRLTYEALVAVKPSRSGSRGVRPMQVQLVPVKRIEGRHIDLGAAPDPYFLLELYGKEQLALALARYPAKALLEAVALVQLRCPGTKPKGRAKPSVIDYLVEQVRV